MRIKKRCIIKKAFTLAEVLIALGIIGIAAALTVPALTAKYQKIQTIASLKKTFSDLNNVIKLSEVQNGEMEYWDFPAENDKEGFNEFVKTYYLPYFAGARFLAGSDFIRKNYFYTNLKGDKLLFYIGNNVILLNDGRILIFQSGVASGYIWVLADLNGYKGPNIVGRDIFVFDVYRYPKSQNGVRRYYVDFWKVASIKDRNIFKSESNYGCSKESGVYSGWYCGALIQHDGWQIKDDYPWGG